MRRPIIARWQIALALFLAGSAFLFVAQLRTRQPLREQVLLPTWRLQELAVLVRQQEAALQRLQAEVEALRRQTLEYEAAVAEGRSLTEQMMRDVAHYRMVLGLVPVEGPGVRVVVAEGPPVPRGMLPPEAQAQDVAGLANELWSAGAEAMAINGVRVLATNGIRQAGRRIAIGGVLLSPPYRIEAIGNPDALRAALSVRGGFVEGLRSVGLRVEVQVPRRLRLPARTAAEPHRLARPLATP